MRPAKSRAHSLLKLGSKAAAFVVVAVLIFSPFNQVFQTPVASAALFCVPIGGVSSDVKASTNQTCPRANQAIQADTLAQAQQQWDQTVQQKKDANANDPINSIASFLAFPLYVFTVGLGGLIAGVGSFIFDEAIQISLSSTAYALSFLSTGWGTARDVANMFFILILIYLAINIMLKADTHGTMNTLAWVLFFALIINFSFFFTRLAIDAGNIAAVQFYNAIVTNVDKSNTTGTQQLVTTLTGKQDLTAAIMQGVGIQNILGTKSFQNFQDKTNGLTEFIVLVFVYLAMGGAYLILGAAFIATAIKFLMRTLVLWLCIIASPLAFVANTMPETKGWYKQWQDKLISNAFYPVAFLFIFWLITLFSKDLNLSTAFDAYAKSNATGFADNIVNLISLIGNIVIRLGFVIGMLMLGLKVADDIGVAGAKMANNAGNRFSFGGAGVIGRNTAGRAGLALTRNDNLRAWAANSAIGSTLLRGAGALSRGSFDARALPGAGQLKNQLGAAEGKGGFAKTSEEKDKKREKAIEALGKGVKGDVVDERLAQERFEATHARDHGGVTYAAAVKSIGDAIKSRDTAVKEAKKRAALAATKEERDAANKEVKFEETKLADLKEALKAKTEAGKKIVDKANHHRSELLAKRLSSRLNAFAPLNPSRGTLKGIAGLTHHETTKDKLEKAVKAVVTEETPTPAEVAAPVHAAAQAARPVQQAETPHTPADNHDH